MLRGLYGLEVGVSGEWEMGYGISLSSRAASSLAMEAGVVVPGSELSSSTKPRPGVKGF